MGEQSNTNYNESFNQEFCTHLEYRLCAAFENSDDEKMASLWCDGVADNFVRRQFNKKTVSDTKKIEGLTAYIGHDGQGFYDLTIKFGPRSLLKYSEGASLVECIPSEESMDWITLDIENKKIEIQLR